MGGGAAGRAAVAAAMPRLPVLPLSARHAPPEAHMQRSAVEPSAQVREHQPKRKQPRKGNQLRAHRPRNGGKEQINAVPKRPLGDASNLLAERPRAAAGRTRSDASLRSSSSGSGSSRSSRSNDSDGSVRSASSASSLSSVDEPDSDDAEVGASSRRRRGLVPSASTPRGDTRGNAVAAPATAMDPGSSEQAHFAMGCYWHAEAVYGGVDGVRSTTVGFVDGVEVVRVTFDSGIVSYTELLQAFREGHEVGKRWANKKFESAVFVGNKQRAEARAGCGAAAVHKLGPFTAGKESDQLYYLRQKLPRLLKPKAKLKLTAAQLTRINHCLAFSLPYEHVLQQARDGSSSSSSTSPGSARGAGKPRVAVKHAAAERGAAVFAEQAQPMPLLRCPLDGGPCMLQHAEEPPELEPEPELQPELEPEPEHVAASVGRDSAGYGHRDDERDATSFCARCQSSSRPL
eukprot:COSAG06_NODE_3455_length_5319_cov_12.049425_5_plen_458_part_01